ncbi:hypothetical protein F4859DRAFT_522068 [Xylaria cf. heliscus]|nr:hypothetical protein F4859DRAFT_522068 [Xylaria cf. heliscus]
MQFTTFALAALSIGSVFAAPPTKVRRDPVLDTAISAINSVETAVASQVAIINTALQGTINNQAITAIQGSLTNIGNVISSATSDVAPLVTDVALPLAQDELDSLPGLLASANETVTDLKTSFSGIANTLTGLTGILVKAQAAAVLSTVNPFVTPITQFADSAIDGITDPVVPIVESTLGDISGIVDDLLGPILDALLGLL